MFPERDALVGPACSPDPQVAIKQHATDARDPLDHFSGYRVELPLVAHCLCHYPFVKTLNHRRSPARGWRSGPLRRTISL
ncbi:hypothetical protein L842_2944 [Mycobacterium intracellulare MIN_052511_1280]|nr:hypothetical protein L842_2944 [Mycobacterium intracellulare MIN_052511_1280]